MKYIYLLLSISALLLFDFYLKSNIVEYYAGSVNLMLLVVVFAIGVVLFVSRLAFSEYLFVRPSFAFLGLFLCYFIFRVVVDTASMDLLKSYGFATSGGIVLYFCMGVLVSNFLKKNYRNAISSAFFGKIYVLSLTIFSLMSLFSLIFVYVALSPNLRDDIYLLSGPVGLYQRPGNFLVIGFLIYSLLCMQAVLIAGGFKGVLLRCLPVILIFSYVTYFSVSLLISQMLGSNNAAIVIFALGVIIFLLVFISRSKKFRFGLETKRLNFSSLFFGFVGRKIFLGAFMGLVVSMLFVYFASFYLGIELAETRLGGFGSGEIPVSVSSRLELLGNFFTHFSFSPLYGNIIVDDLTTGGGYVHSFLLSILTHMGLVGFFLVVAYIVNMYIDLMKVNDLCCGSSNQKFSESVYRLYSLMTISVMLVISCFANFFVNAGTWFAIGLFFTGVYFKPKLKSPGLFSLAPSK